jgi:hypothetical protein
MLSKQIKSFYLKFFCFLTQMSLGNSITYKLFHCLCYRQFYCWESVSIWFPFLKKSDYWIFIDDLIFIFGDLKNNHFKKILHFHCHVSLGVFPLHSMGHFNLMVLVFSQKRNNWQPGNLNILIIQKLYKDMILKLKGLVNLTWKLASNTIHWDSSRTCTGC